MNQEIGYERKLDTSGLNCPLPILKTKKELVTMSIGERLYVVATDPGSVPDFRVFSEQTGHTLLVCDERDGEYHFVLRKNG